MAGLTPEVPWGVGMVGLVPGTPWVADWALGVPWVVVEGTLASVVP